jgi:hypothetical protein
MSVLHAKQCLDRIVAHCDWAISALHLLQSYIQPFHVGAALVKGALDRVQWILDEVTEARVQLMGYGP